MNLFGHANPRINAAVRDQLERLEHVIFAGFTHEPAVRLAEATHRAGACRADALLFADNGSAAVEVALKMSFHYWRNRGRPRKTRYVTLANSYHGETLGALAVGNVELYKSSVQTAADGRAHRAVAGLLSSASPARPGSSIRCASSSTWSACSPPTPTRSRR